MWFYLPCRYDIWFQAAAHKCYDVYNTYGASVFHMEVTGVSDTREKTCSVWQPGAMRPIRVALPRLWNEKPHSLHCLELIDLHLGQSPRPQMFVWVRTCVVRFSKAVDRWTRCAQFLERHARDLFLLLHLAHCSPTSPLWFPCDLCHSLWRGGKSEWNRAVTATFPLMLPLVSVWALVGVEKWHQSSFHTPVLKL